MFYAQSTGAVISGRARARERERERERESNKRPQLAKVKVHTHKAVSAHQKAAQCQVPVDNNTSTGNVRLISPGTSARSLSRTLITDPLHFPD